VAQSPPVAFGNRKRRFQRVGKCLTLPSSGADRAGFFRVRVKHLPTPGSAGLWGSAPEPKNRHWGGFFADRENFASGSPEAIVLDVLIQAIPFG